ncbi:S-layer homology domain-containing protein [Bacillus solitudinis]|uniref:S-layer homology domain-containing protein n=1 Tax=Bacillus solitudinis TaxID=2014074 RepID=UPI000C23F08D|nr:S-layer homology domain-containing protein [Bacillus solitudinis]
MKKIMGIFTLLCVLIIMPAYQASAASLFTDVDKDFWAFEDINTLVKEGAIKGYEDGTFQPNKPVTRAQAAIILTKVLNLDTAKAGEVPYRDIEKEYHAYAEVAAVTEAGLMSGNNGNFIPNKPLTRAQMAVLVTTAFELQGDGSSAFRDIKEGFWAEGAIDALFTNDITTGYENGTFRPNAPTTRAQFASFIIRAEGKEESLAELLKKAYTNQMNLDTYQFSGAMDLAIELPESMLAEPELAELGATLSDIEVQLEGAYQREPNVIEMDTVVQVGGDVGVSMKVSTIMTEEKMWMKIPSSPFMPIPEEVAGKYIEVDLATIPTAEGEEDLGQIDLELQTKLALALYDVYFEHFTDDFYQAISLDSVTYPSNIQAKQAVKFELSNENLELFAATLLEDFLPDFITYLGESPEMAEQLGLEEGDLELALEELNSFKDELPAAIAELQNILDLKTFEELIIINEENQIAYNELNLDAKFHIEEETIGLKLNMEQEITSFNEEINFAEFPSGDDVITLDELMMVLMPAPVE